VGTVKASALSPEHRVYLSERYGLDESELDLLIEDIWSFTGEEPESFLIRRHRELQAEGWTNEAIFGRLARELSEGRFASPPRSTRQIRRVIYG